MAVVLLRWNVRHRDIGGFLVEPAERHKMLLPFFLDGPLEDHLCQNVLDRSSLNLTISTLYVCA